MLGVLLSCCQVLSSGVEVGELWVGRRSQVPVPKRAPSLNLSRACTTDYEARGGDLDTRLFYGRLMSCWTGATLVESGLSEV